MYKIKFGQKLFFRLSNRECYEKLVGLNLSFYIKGAKFPLWTSISEIMSELSYNEKFYKKYALLLDWTTKEAMKELFEYECYLGGIDII